MFSLQHLQSEALADINLQIRAAEMELSSLKDRSKRRQISEASIQAEIEVRLETLKDRAQRVNTYSTEISNVIVPEDAPGMEAKDSTRPKTKRKVSTAQA
jgi:hypothetical protein